MKRTNLSLLFVMAILLSSCQQETFESIALKEDAAREIGFIQNTDLHSPFTRSSWNSSRNDYETNLGIKARIARKKTGCKSGFGLCDIRAMNKQETFVRFQARSSNSVVNKYECTTTCTIDSTGRGVVYFLLADSPESKGLTQTTMPPLYVDEEIEQPIEENPLQSLLVKSGVYRYQKELGENGGYAVSVLYKK